MTVERAPHYCQDGHAPVRFWRDTEPEELACPACDIASQLERAQGEGENLRARVAELERDLAQSKADALTWEQTCDQLEASSLNWCDERSELSARISKLERELSAQVVKSGELERENAALREAAVRSAYMLSCGRGVKHDHSWRERGLAAHAVLAPLAKCIEETPTATTKDQLNG
jgi:chromosome segregation ATPase